MDKFQYRARLLKEKSEAFRSAYERVKPYNPERARIYLAKSQNLRQLSQEARLQSKTYREMYLKAKECLASNDQEDDHHDDGDREDDDHEDDDHED